MNFKVICQNASISKCPMLSNTGERGLHVLCLLSLVENELITSLPFHSEG